MIRRSFLALGLVALMGVSAVASETHADQVTAWSGSLTGKNGGHATVECDHPSRGTNVRLHAGGLVPKGQYVVYFVDYDGKEKPMGTSGGQATADSNGYLYYQSLLPQCPLADKLKIVIRYQNPPAPAQDVLTGVLVQQ